MLGHQDTRSRGHQGRRGRNVERAQAIAACAHDVQDSPRPGRVIQHRLQRAGAQGAGKSGDLLNRFALERKMAKEISLNGGRNCFVDQLLDGPIDLFICQQF